MALADSRAVVYAAGRMSRASFVTTLLLAIGLGAASAHGAASVVPGAVTSSVRGPYGYVSGPIPKGMTVAVTLASNRIELHPDFVVIEQTLTLNNQGKRLSFELGVDQAPVSTGRPAVRTFVPLGAAGWLDGIALADGLVRVRDRQLDNSGGYAVGVRLTLDPGEHVLTVTMAIQSVANIDLDGAQRPAGNGPSVFAAELGISTSGFALDEEASPPVRTMLVGADGVTPDHLDAFEWTEGASTVEGRVYWVKPVRLGLSYTATGNVSRASTTDELTLAARATLARPPHGHLAVPPGVVPFQRPGETQERRSEDAQRALRALLVPISGLFVTVLLLYFYRRRKERRR